jgi:Protein of unknown function (DUF3306)
MAEIEHDAGFLARWSRRKAEARLCKELPSPAEKSPDVEPVVPHEKPANLDAAPEAGALSSECLPVAASTATSDAEAPAPLTLADVAKLDPESDFTPFLRGDVSTEVKNAALKKLFADPHFNRMDGLDVYIDDYNSPSPLPQHLIAKMAQAKFLGLVKDKAEETLARLADAPPGAAGEEQPARAAPDVPRAESIAHHEDADLQLQPHDDAGRAGAEQGSGHDTGREH